MKNLELLPKISVIIPVYNSENYIFISIKSVLDQTYSNFEIICIDDGSTDRSAEIIKHLMLEDDRIKLIQIDNHGQGFARNLGVKKANGDYILFLDSDDYIEKNTLSICLEKIKKEDPDFVVFDYRYYRPIDKKNIYTSDDLFFKYKNLIEDSCLELLKLKVIYTVNKIYKKNFLLVNEIKYLEGHLYEDMIFMIKAIICAKKISLIHSPLYRITINKNSSTQTKHDTDKHYKSFISALTMSIEFLNSKKITDNRVYYLYLNLFKKFLNYYVVRTPYKYKNKFACEFLNTYSRIYVPYDFKQSKFFSICLKYNVFKNKRNLIFNLMLVYATYMKPLLKKLKRDLKMKLKNFIKKVMFKLKLLKNKKYYNQELKKPLFDDVILFMGFDHRYTGNSRYLFEEMLKMDLKGKKMFFATDDPLVPLEYRIKPYSERCEKFVARSKIIIFESWIPIRYVKRKNTKWIQLWHGTPVKKMLFDSNEKCIIEKNPNHKKNKYNDILKWDYLITDNINANQMFNSAFLMDENKMLPYGYPRVKYIVNKVADDEYKNKLKELIGIPNNKKVVLYVPTWRDYNFGKSVTQYDLNYLINLNDLQEKLGEDYFIVYKDHPFVSAPQNVNFKNYATAETQDLLLIADFLITDYSSIIFDAFAINLPVIIYCNDFKKNEEVRGVYANIWNLLNPYLCATNDEIKSLIKKYEINDEYEFIKNMYAYKNSKKGSSLSKFILEL